MCRPNARAFLSAAVRADGVAGRFDRKAWSQLVSVVHAGNHRDERTGREPAGSAGPTGEVAEPHDLRLAMIGGEVGGDNRSGWEVDPFEERRRTDDAAQQVLAGRRLDGLAHRSG